MARTFAEVSAAATGGLESIAADVRGSFQTVEDMTVSFIREAIVRGVFQPGERLNLDAIAATLGVSRMPVRAGLRQLEVEGLVRMHAYRGATVAVLTPAEIAEVYELRAVLETYLLREAMARLDDALLDRLSDIIEGLEGITDLAARMGVRREFYRELYAAAGKDRALTHVMGLRSSVGRYLILRQLDVDHGPDELLALLRAREVDKAAVWLQEHLDRVSTRLQQLVAAELQVSADAG